MGATFLLTNSTAYTSAFYNAGTDVIYLPKIAANFSYTVNITAPANVMPFLWMWTQVSTLAINFIDLDIVGDVYRPQHFAVPSNNLPALQSMPLICHPETELGRLGLCPILGPCHSPFLCPLNMVWGSTNVAAYIVPGLMHIVVPTALTGPLDRNNHVCYVLDTKFVDGSFAVCSDDKVYVNELPRYVLLTAEEMGLTLPSPTAIAFGTSTDLFPLNVYVYSLLGPRILVGKAWVSQLDTDTTRIVCVFLIFLTVTIWGLWCTTLERALVATRHTSGPSMALTISLCMTVLGYGLYTFVLWYNIYETGLADRAYRNSLTQDVEQNTQIVNCMIAGFHLFLLLAQYLSFVQRDRWSVAVHALRDIAYMTCAMLAWSALMIGDTELTGDMIANLAVTIPYLYLSVASSIEFYRAPKTPRDRWLAFVSILAYGLLIPFVITVNLNSIITYLQDFHGSEASLCGLLYFLLIEQGFMNNWETKTTV